MIDLVGHSVEERLHDAREGQGEPRDEEVIALGSRDGDLDLGDNDGGGEIPNCRVNGTC